MKLFAGQHVEQLSQPTAAPNERHSCVLSLLPRNHLKLESRARMFWSVQQNVEVGARHSAAILALLLLCAVPVSAQTSGQSFARGMSWGTLGAGVGLASVQVFKSDHKTKGALKIAASLGLTGASTLLAKKLFPEARPCAPNDCGQEQPNASFWSGHVANACAVIPLRSGKAALITGVALASLTAVGRIWGNRHRLWPDVALGCVDGAVNNALMSKVFR